MAWQTLTMELLKNVDGQLKSTVVQEAAFYVCGPAPSCS